MDAFTRFRFRFINYLEVFIFLDGYGALMSFRTAVPSH